MKIKTTYVLRVCKPDLTSHNGFKWPQSGPVSAPDWDPSPKCGGGLHGWAMGEGDASSQDYSSDPNAKYLVVRVRTTEIVALGGKVKFPRGTVVYCGDAPGAAAKILRKHPRAACHWAMVTGGNYATVTGGNWAKVTGGHSAKVTGGDGATVTGGYGAMVTGGNYATVTGGNYATVTGGVGATVKGGNRATVTGGDGATVTGGYGAMVTGGNGATLQLSFFDGSRTRIVTAYVGEGGIEAWRVYMLMDGKFDEVKS
jgi:hypothetical protein